MVRERSCPLKKKQVSVSLGTCRLCVHTDLGLLGFARCRRCDLGPVTGPLCVLSRVTGGHGVALRSLELAQWPQSLGSAIYGRVSNRDVGIAWFPLRRPPSSKEPLSLTWPPSQVRPQLPFGRHKLGGGAPWLLGHCCPLRLPWPTPSTASLRPPCPRPLGWLWLFHWGPRGICCGGPRIRGPSHMCLQPRLPPLAGVL